MAGSNQNNAGGQFTDFPVVQTHGGQFVQYNIFGNLFEITSKYRPPIMPIGRGAYGIVWYVFDGISDLDYQLAKLGFWFGFFISLLVFLTWVCFRF